MAVPRVVVQSAVQLSAASLSHRLLLGLHTTTATTTSASASTTSTSSTMRQEEPSRPAGVARGHCHSARPGYTDSEAW
eukprot:1819172-Rhodomonas_salina.1